MLTEVGYGGDMSTILLPLIGALMTRPAEGVIPPFISRVYL